MCLICGPFVDVARAQSGPSNLKASSETDKVLIRNSPLLPRDQRGISMSPDRHGSGATRIEADLSIK
jgi:hypothetical protein